MAVLTFSNIMEAEDITETTVPVDEWGGDVVVRSISYRKMGKIKAKVANERGTDADSILDDDTDVEKLMIVAGMVEPEVTEEEADLLMEKSASAVLKVLSAIMSSSKMGDKDVKEEEKSLPTESE